MVLFTLLMPVVEKITELVISVEGFVDETTSLLPSIMVILVVDILEKYFVKFSRVLAACHFFPFGPSIQDFNFLYQKNGDIQA